MKGSILSALFALFSVLMLQIAASPVQQQTQKARIEGSVLRVGTGEGVVGARVTLTRGRGAAPAAAAPVVLPAGARAGAATPPKPIPFAVTDNQGKFSFQDLDEASYTVQILANGYVSQNYGQRYTNGPGTPIAMKAGEDLKDLTVNLTPASNVSGRIRDRSDQPLSNVPVQLMRYSYDSQGQRTYQNVGAATTNDRGEYRIYWITPGRYYLLAGNAASGSSSLLQMLIMMESGAGNPNDVPVVMGYAFYPGVPDIGSARTLDLQPGADLDSVNLTLPPRQQSFRIRGRVIDSRTGQPPAKARVVASAQTPGIGSNGSLDEIGLELPINNYNAANGTFEIRDQLPGAYLVTAVVQDPAPPAPAGGRGGAPYQPPTTSTGMTTIVVADSDVEGVLVTVAPAVTVTGRIRADGQQQLPVTPDRMRVQLTSRNPSAAMSTILNSSFGGSSATPAADGTFRFPNVALGDYRITLQSLGGALPAGARPGSNAIYIKEARYDNADVLAGGLHIAGSAAGVLDVVVASGGGQVTGTLTDSRSKAVPVTQVVAVPDRSRDRVDLYRTVTTDENGKFNFFSLVPGDYKVFSWEGLEPYSWFDPDVMTRSENKGHPVRVTDISTESIDLKVIPKENAQ